MESYKHHRIPLYKCHKYFCELINAVDYLHSNNIVHKDIKTGEWRTVGRQVNAQVNQLILPVEQFVCVW